MQKHLPKNMVVPQARQTQHKTLAGSNSEPLQRMLDLEEEDLLQGKFAKAFGDPAQRQALDPIAPIQRMPELEEEDLLQGKFQPIQRKENNTGLPDDLKSGVENLSGYSMDDVQVHYNSDQPAQLNAHAYAQGTDIHIAPGQEQHLPHEAWHVVQQKQGRVRPTMQLKGKVNVNDDVGLEREADVMGGRAMQLSSKHQNAKPIHVHPNKGTLTNAPLQLMAVSRFQTNKYKQAGGTCGLYSLGMAISSVDPGVVGHEDNLLYALLRAGNEAGTFVGEFMDANNLAQVGRNLGVSVRVIDFVNQHDFIAKLNGTGADGVIMGYSVFENENAQTQLDLAGFEYLFSHWSMIEAMNPPDLTVRDPNTPTATRPVSIAAFYRQNQQADNPGGFGFQDFQDQVSVRPGEASVQDLRGAWVNDELDQRAGHAVANQQLPQAPQALPNSPLNLKGKIVSVSGRVRNLGRTSENVNLRAGNDKSVITNLGANTRLLILDRKKAGRFFQDPDKSVFKSLPRFHYWVKTEAGDIGWVRENAIQE